jgi:hypothetical protein
MLERLQPPHNDVQHHKLNAVSFWWLLLVVQPRLAKETSWVIRGKCCWWMDVFSWRSVLCL